MPAVRHIGRYRLDQVIGTGAFATVHRATDERLDDTVAVKVLADNHSLDPDVRERFLTEGRVLRRVDSHHVVRVHDIGETEMHQPFLVLEHADRGTLAHRVTELRARGWTPGQDDIRAVARPLAGAVEAVHRARIVHRDLSPGNILLRSTMAPRDDPDSAVVASDERLLLADLGLCKDLAVHSGMTVASGTEGFRPPEQRGQPARVDARADLWALSALLVWLIAGDPPGDQPVVAAVHSAGFPNTLGEALATSLAADPARRHPDVSAWLDALEAALTPPTNQAPTSQPPTSQPPAEDPAEERSRRRSVVHVVAALAAGAVLGAGAMLASDGAANTVVTRLDDNLIEATHTVGAARLAITGPAQVTVGETATFNAESRDVDDWVWLMPDGTVSAGATQVRLRAQSTGTAPVTLVGVSSAGDRLEAVHDLLVTEGEGERQ